MDVISLNEAFTASCSYIFYTIFASAQIITILITCSAPTTLVIFTPFITFTTYHQPTNAWNKWNNKPSWNIKSSGGGAGSSSLREDVCIGHNLRSCCMKTLNGKDSAEEVCKKHNCPEDACNDFNPSGGGGGWNSWSKVSKL